MTAFLLDISLRKAPRARDAEANYYTPREVNSEASTDCLFGIGTIGTPTGVRLRAIPAPQLEPSPRRFARYGRRSLRLAQLAFSSLIERPLMNSPIVGGIARVMAAQRKGMANNSLSSAGKVGSTDALLDSNEPLLRLARLIGRQIAREQFERQDSWERKLLRQRNSKSM